MREPFPIDSEWNYGNHERHEKHARHEKVRDCGASRASRASRTARDSRDSTPLPSPRQSRGPVSYAATLSPAAGSLQPPPNGPEDRFRLRDAKRQRSCTVHGSKDAEYKVNGTVVNGLTDMEVDTGGGNFAPLDKGPIAVQAEFAEVYFRNIQIKVLP